MWNHADFLTCFTALETFSTMRSLSRRLSMGLGMASATLFIQFHSYLLIITVNNLIFSQV